MVKRCHFSFLCKPGADLGPHFKPNWAICHWFGHFGAGWTAPLTSTDEGNWGKMIFECNVRVHVIPVRPAYVVPNLVPMNDIPCPNDWAYRLIKRTGEAPCNPCVLLITLMLQMTRIIIPQMVARGKGVIVHLSSVSGIFPIPLATGYSASKAFNKFMARALHQEYKDKGIINQVKNMCSAKYLWGFR